MSRACAQCGKMAVRANHVSHSNIKVPRRQHPNLQYVTTKGERLKICSSCRRTITKQLA